MIAQGSIFVIKGNNLGPATLTIAPSAFQSATLSGTSVNVTVAGTTVAALMYYTSVGQVAALLPSNTPVGTGTITATYSGQTGPPHPITVAPSNVGIFSVTSGRAGRGNCDLRGLQPGVDGEGGELRRREHHVRGGEPGGRADCVGHGVGAGEWERRVGRGAGRELRRCR